MLICGNAGSLPRRRVSPAVLPKDGPGLADQSLDFLPVLGGSREIRASRPSEPSFFLETGSSCFRLKDPFENL